MPARRGLRSRAALTAPSAAPTASSTRPRRGTTNQPPPAAVIERSSPEDTRQSIHLTVKASPNKLRKATSGSVAKTAVSSRNIVSGKRASRSSRVIREVDSDDEDEEEDDGDELEPDAMDVDEEDEEEEEDAEGEEDDDVDAEGEEDDEMDDATPVPAIVPTRESNRSKPSISVTKPQDKVEAKEIAMADDDDDDDELSELESDEAEEEDAEGEDDDAEGEDDDEIIRVQHPDDDEDEEMDSDDDLSRSHTPDLSKLTRRQRAMHVDDSDGALMALSNGNSEAQKKKHLTAEEHAMRRAEMARRRKNLSEKRNEEEKMDTINRLLKKQPPKRGRKPKEEATESGQEDEAEVEKANPLFVRYVQNASGTRMAVPEEWLQGPVGSIFAGPLAKPSNRPFSARMVEEVS
ncbi:PAPA-1-domain-containing protein [Lophiostoma macrostomum CBS 122681]|uniref:PAPA-1-domain-containing protein n=1 Tax=Lophiostoma macrostomum CBS 122681 TaxID=1314788 RepID=A0A6A6TIA1_9PLEO|nr:PAPA-1-domain-containing protein [Lophiostoma macrostomum CBS 122681]